MVVEAGLADRHHLRRGGQLADRLEQGGVEAAGVVRVEPRGGPQAVGLAGQRHGGRGVLGVGADRHQLGHPGLAGAVQHGPAVLLEPRVGQVEVGVEGALPAVHRPAADPARLLGSAPAHPAAAAPAAFRRRYRWISSRAGEATKIEE